MVGTKKEMEKNKGKEWKRKRWGRKRGGDIKTEKKARWPLVGEREREEEK